MSKATQGRETAEFLHGIMDETDYGQLKELISDRSERRQDRK